MKLMPALPESIFDICYLIFAISGGIVMLQRSKGKNSIRLFGVMSLILGCGDAFHLVPRVLNYWLDGDFTAALGIGKLVTSITMTIFYLLMEYARRSRYKIDSDKAIITSVWVFAVSRIVLCCFPQNEWTSADPSLLWGILRNIPFAVIGVMSVVLWYRCAKQDKPVKLLWLAVTLSFLFYIPVVLFSQRIPIVGMLMLPKTCMYIWMIIMFKKAEKQHAPEAL